MLQGSRSFDPKSSSTVVPVLSNCGSFGECSDTGSDCGSTQSRSTEGSGSQAFDVDIVVRDLAREADCNCLLRASAPPPDDGVESHGQVEITVEGFLISFSSPPAAAAEPGPSTDTRRKEEEGDTTEPSAEPAATRLAEPSFHKVRERESPMLPCM